MVHIRSLEISPAFQLNSLLSLSPRQIQCDLLFQPCKYHQHTYNQEERVYIKKGRHSVERKSIFNSSGMWIGLSGVPNQKSPGLIPDLSVGILVREFIMYRFSL